MPRFVVRGVTGYSAVGGGVKASTSYSVLDSAYNYREVALFYVGRAKSDETRLRAAETECDRLNEWAATA